MTLKENIRLSCSVQLLRQERKVLLLKLHIAVPSPCRNLCIISMDWPFFLLFPPLILRHMPWDNRICSFPCPCNSGHAIDADSCLGLGANKNECCSGDNIPEQILQGKHKIWNLGLRCRKPWKQHKPCSWIHTGSNHTSNASSHHLRAKSTCNVQFFQETYVQMAPRMGLRCQHADMRAEVGCGGRADRCMMSLFWANCYTGFSYHSTGPLQLRWSGTIYLSCQKVLEQ